MKVTSNVEDELALVRVHTCYQKERNNMFTQFKLKVKHTRESEKKNSTRGPSVPKLRDKNYMPAIRR